MARKSGFVRRHGVMRRDTVWVGASFITGVLASTNAVQLVTTFSAAALAMLPFTIVRTRGGMHVRSDQTGASEGYGIQMGMAVVSDQAVAIGVTAVPTPDSDINSDLWFVYEQFFSRFEFVSGVGVLDIGHYFSYDSKAMRKVDIGQDLVQVVEAPNTSCAFQDSFRMLLKLH